MGIGDFLKRGVSEMMVARPDEAKGFIIYKHPDKTIPMKSQLTVDSDELAVFFKDGKVQGIIQPGRHTLETSNIPFLSNFIDSFTGGDVLMAEVFFVTMRELPDFKFGGRIGAVEDPKSGIPVETMVHGTYSLRVTDAQKLLLGLHGMQSTDNDATVRWIRDQLLKTIRDNVAELLVKKKWPLLDVTSGAYTEKIKKHVDSYGVSIVRMGNFVISIKDDDAAELKKLYRDAAYVRMAGGMQGYQQFAAGKAMMGAGEGMAKGGGDGGGGGGGGGLLGGAGLGVGFGLAGAFQQNMAGGQGAPQQGGGYPQGSAGPGQGQVQGASGAPAAGGGVQGSGVTCAACGNTVNPGKFCSSCGQALAAPKQFCSNCGTELAAGIKFCSDCGTAAP